VTQRDESLHHITGCIGVQMTLSDSIAAARAAHDDGEPHLSHDLQGLLGASNKQRAWCMRRADEIVALTGLQVSSKHTVSRNCCLSAVIMSYC
jgi:hypothetical protein